MAMVAKKSDVSRKTFMPFIAAVPVERFTPNDFMKIGKWVLGRMTAQWTHFTERQAIGFLKSCSESREYHFTRTEHAVLLARLVSVPLEPNTHVEEMFCFLTEREDNNIQAEGALLYRGCRDWARGIGAMRLVVNRYSDVSPPFIGIAVGTTESEQREFVRIKPYAV